MQDTQSTVESPCRGICRLDKATRVCTGCLRTIDEIASWSRMSVEQKQAVVTACRSRQQIPSNSGNSLKSDNMAAGTPGSNSEG